MARVCIREWALPVEEAEVAFPPPPETFAVNPLGQVPLLTVGDEAVFPTLLILERLGRWPEGRERPTTARATGRSS